MSQLTLATLCAALVWLALIAYAALGGADFGGGVWDRLARGPLAQRERTAIARAMGPVWEANHVWLIYVLVVTWTAFPIVYAAVSTALFFPVTLALIGIVLRGAAFGFRSNYGIRVGMGVAWGHVFDIASALTPFLFGAIAGALASGAIRVYGQPLAVHANYWTTWTTPFALACGAFAVGLCAVLAATYLTVEADTAGDRSLTSVFRVRAIVAGAVVAVIGAVAAALAYFEAPALWRGLIGRALPFSLGAVLIGLAAAATLLLGSYKAARVLVAAETACIITAWGVAQWPYLIVPDVTIQNAASPTSTLSWLVLVSVIGLAVLLPSLWFLFRVFKGGSASAGPRVTAAAFAVSLEPNATSASPRADREANPAQPEVPSAQDGLPAQPFVSMLAFSLAVAAATLVTGIRDALRGRSERRRSRSRG